MVMPFSIGCHEGSLKIGADGTVVECTITPVCVAHGLGAVTRFGGQTPRPYSVAEHSVRLAALLREQGYGPVYQAAALLHDAPEAFGVGDVNRYVKRAYNLDGLKTFDRHLTETFWASLGAREQYNVEWAEIENVIHEYDAWIGHYEANYFGFVVPEHAQWVPTKYRPRTPDSFAFGIGYWEAKYAKTLWLASWNERNKAVTQ